MTTAHRYTGSVQLNMVILHMLALSYGTTVHRCVDYPTFHSSFLYFFNYGNNAMRHLLGHPTIP
jgi:hypothetical protein